MRTIWFKVKTSDAQIVPTLAKVCCLAFSQFSAYPLQFVDTFRTDSIFITLSQVKLNYNQKTIDNADEIFIHRVCHDVQMVTNQ